ncbi:PF09907 domain protein [Capnocytophaga sp. CM59]|nr:PF09907 domain protein [Capnocytophaga sp. CM59]
MFSILKVIISIVALILFTPKILYIRFVGTHKEYDDIENIDKI